MENQDEFSENCILETTYIVEEQKNISLNKFIFLSIISFGTYPIWWIYKAWRFFQQKDKLDIMPAVRTIFSIFFLISLFNKILNFAKEKDYNKTYSAILLFVGFFIVDFLAKLPDPFWLISVISFVFCILPFKALNFAKRNSTDFIVIEQTSYSGRQIVLIVIGAIFWCFVLLSLTITDL
jgi:hypothetical protein